MKNKKFWMGILVMILVFGITVIGCVSYTYTQAVRNETGVTVTEVYIRETGTTGWGDVRNVQGRYREDGSVYWERTNMNNGTQIVLFRDRGSSETPREMKNQDILVKDSNGLLYMKQNVPITFAVTKTTDYILIGGPSEEIAASTPIIFTVKDRLPMLFVVNQTGYAVTLIAPVQNPINNGNGGRIQFQPMEINRSIDVTYRIAQATYTEQVTMGNEDATVTLTKRPPTLTIVNNVGSTINFIFLRIPGSPSWTGGNIFIRDGTVFLRTTAQTGDISGSIVNRDNMKIWLGNVPLSGSIFDIRIDDVQGNSYVKSNVQVTSDMTLTFTQSDKR